LAALYLAVLGRLVELQAFPEADRWQAGTQPRESRKALPAMRGRILDREGRVLADSLARWQLVMDMPAKERRYLRPKSTLSMAEIQAEVAPIAALIGKSPQFLLDRLLDETRTYAVVARSLPPAEVSQLRALLRAASGTGLRLQEEEVRVYPQGRTLAHLLGFTRAETPLARTGACGLEAMLEERLQGTDGSRKTMRVGRGFGVNPALEAASPERAKDVVTTLDSTVGEILREELESLQEVHQPDWTFGVVLEVDTAHILAMGAWPDFNPNAPGEVEVAEDGSLIGHGFPGMWPFEPGSTMKPLIVSRALAEGAIGASQRFSQEGHRWYARGARQPPIRNAEGVPDEPLDWREILVHSSNIGAGKVGLALGAERTEAAIVDWGLKDATHLPWRDQNVLFPPKVEWVKRPQWTIPAVSMGHQVQTTGIRLAAAYAALVGDGVLKDPRLFGDQEVAEPRRVLAQEIALQVRGVLQDMVEAGHRTHLHHPELEWGGKSGTVQKTHGQEVGNYTSLFVGFAPVENPRYVCVVVADNPKGKHHYGSQVAGPAVRDILHRSLGVAETRQVQIHEAIFSSGASQILDEGRVADTLQGE